MSSMLCHSDEVSGITILDDGTKVYWTEGFSDLVIKHPDGRSERVNQEHPITQRPELSDNAVHEIRPMTEAEEQEWASARQS